jgi:septal ring factor EnvC (AmiA/AmiB activator)
MRTLRRRRRRALLAALFTAASVAACGNPRTEANVAQALNDAAMEISGLKNDIALLSTEIDSLRQVVAKQDSTIARIAAVNNIPISR